MKQDFDVFFQANERRVHYQIHRLGITSSWYGEFYAEGIYALWKAYQGYDEVKGNLGTYLNYRIRYHLIDTIRKKKREEDNEETRIQLSLPDINDGNRLSSPNIQLVNISDVALEDTEFWDHIRKHLSDNQWKWVQYFIIADLSIREIMEIENVSADAVKGWGQSVRKKLRNEKMKDTLEKILRSS